jgi:endoplasmic reticulum Man9GlcNAc2 1,2-alpha-mannosidase
MGCDEYRPISRSGYNLSSQGGIGYTVVDALDTMYLMGLKEEYQRSYKWVKESLSFDKNGQYITFEVSAFTFMRSLTHTIQTNFLLPPPPQITIRVLGGLLSSYALTADKVFLNQAMDLANRILPVFHTPSGLPLPYVNLAIPPDNKLDDNWAFGGKVSLAEVATLQLEFRYLSLASGEWKFWEAVEKVMKTVEKGWKVDGLSPVDIM